MYSSLKHNLHLCPIECRSNYRSNYRSYLHERYMAYHFIARIMRALPVNTMSGSYGDVAGFSAPEISNLWNRLDHIPSLLSKLRRSGVLYNLLSLILLHPHLHSNLQFKLLYYTDFLIAIHHVAVQEWAAVIRLYAPSRCRWIRKWFWRRQTWALPISEVT